MLRNKPFICPVSQDNFKTVLNGEGLTVPRQIFCLNIYPGREVIFVYNQFRASRTVKATRINASDLIIDFYK